MPSRPETAARNTAASATQCRSNPVSDRSLPKTGAFQIAAGDYRLFRSENVENWSLECKLGDQTKDDAGQKQVKRAQECRRLQDKLVGDQPLTPERGEEIAVILDQTG